MQHRSLLLILILPFWAQADATPESTQLALALKQLDSVKVSLDRAKASTKTNPQSRYYFDYPAAQQDISEIERGINRYLSPSRAQPRRQEPLRANYQREAPRD
ncbi:raqprd family integrative conjugative element protein [Citrobacter freundii]|nr:raqprd family integrative conjugative element protein [Citrobacter freundii]